jgi:hypothetical protein
MLAQMFSGMEFIPLIILSNGIGLTAAAFGTLIAAFNKRSVIAWWCAFTACFLGIGMPLLMLFRVGGLLDLTAYQYATAPLITGLVAFAMIYWPNDEHPRLRTSNHPAKPGRWMSRAMRASVVAIVFVPALFMVNFCCIRPIDTEDIRNKIAVGMTTAEVQAVFGKPHYRNSSSEGTEAWTYETDWGRLGYFAVYFDEVGRVREWWLE